MHEVQTPTIIMNPVPFSSEYVPEKLQGRDNQLKRMHACLAPALKKRKPLHMWLHGPPGSGKTAAAAHVLRHVKQKTPIRGLLVNCWQKDTYFELLDEIVFQLRILRAEEHRTSTKLDKLASFLRGQPFVIVLDEIDKMRPAERSATLYGLDSLGNVCLVCVSSSLAPWFELEERVRSRLSPCLVPCPAYSRNELVGILASRARAILAEETCSTRVLERIARAASGDARVAIHSLQVLAESAENERLRAISDEGLARQRAELQLARSAHVLAGLTEDHRILYALTQQKGSIQSGELWEKYLRHCASTRRRPVAPRTFSEYANHLVRAGLMICERARVKGKVRLFKVVT